MEKYNVKGEMKFSFYDGEGIVINVKEYKEDWEKFYANKDVYDLMSGTEFIKHVDSGSIIDYDGSIANIFVDGYDSNLGLFHKGICQGGFLVDRETFLDICDDYKVEVNWANK